MKLVKQVIVMRNDLNMRKGKQIAQGAHASIAFLLYQITIDGDRINMTFQPHNSKVIKEWMENGQTKICVRAESEEELMEIYKKANKANLKVHYITDAGLTEFKGVPTKTCLAIGPDYADDIDLITSNLKLL